MFHSELAATQGTGGEYRVGVGISRVAEALLVAFEQLRQPVYKQVIVEKQLNAALAEMNQLEPHLKVLNAGKGSQQQEDGGAVGFNNARAMAARSSSRAVPVPDDGAIERAAKAFHQWLSKPQTPLRALLAILGGHGAFYAAQVHEKVARAWLQEKHVTEGDVAQAARTRISGAAPSGLTARAQDEEIEGLVA